MGAIKTNKNKQVYWEVYAPEPFIIDPAITDEQVISNMISASHQSEISEVLHSLMQRPMKTFIIFCSENELKKLFSFKCNGYKCKIENYPEGLLISITNDDDEFIGRGEIIKLGRKINKSKVKIEISNHMSDFINKHKIGDGRIKSIMFKMETIKNKMSADSIVLN